MTEIFGGIFLFAGCLMTLISAAGIARYPDVLSRQHVATKPQVVSLIFNLVGAALLVQDPTMTWTTILVVAFMLITSPISAHMLSRAAYRTGKIDTSKLVADELGEDLQFVPEPEDNENVTH